LNASAAAQALRDTVDQRLARAPAAQRDAVLRLRGEGEAANPDTSYGSITVVPPERETIVSLQEKLAYMLKLLQQADARPTSQAITAMEALLARLDELKSRATALSAP
jgi:hypothetical protein